MKHFLNIILVAFVSGTYAAAHWYKNFPIVNWITSPNFYKPFVYRQLVPFIVRGMSEFMRTDLALILVVTLAGMGFYVALFLLGKHFGVYNELWALSVVLVSLMMLGWHRTPYDLMTAFLWTLALLFIFQHNHIGFTTLFPILCLNRLETSILLVGLWAWMYRKEVLFVLSQGTIWIGLYLVLHLVFANNPGTDMWVRPLENINSFLSNLPVTMTHMAVLIWIVILTLHNWTNKDYRLRTVFLLLIPIFIGLYIVLGEAFEIRVFWETVPVVGLMIRS